MDAVKLVGVILLVALSVAVLVTGLASLTSGSGLGEWAVNGLRDGWEESDGQHPSWSPVDAGVAVLGSLTGSWDSWGEGGSAVGWIAYAVLGLASVVLAIFGLKLAFRVWGG